MSDRNEKNESYSSENDRENMHKSKARKVFLILAVAVAFVGGCIYLFLRTDNSLTGNWVYDEYTQYVFEENGSGCLKADDVHYEYTYKISGNQLYMDFTGDVVRDCEYTFSVEGNRLTLIGGDNTDGGTYTLTREK